MRVCAKSRGVLRTFVGLRRAGDSWGIIRFKTVGVANTIELLSDVPDPLLDFAHVLRAGR
jgi:hypothetical protein